MTMFPPPQELPTEVFARVPDRLRKPQRSDWADVKRRQAPLDSFLEGPSFDRAGNLYVVDIPHGRVFRVSPGGDFEVVTEYDGWPNGLKIRNDGQIFIADHRRGIMQLDPASGQVSPHCTEYLGEPFKGTNDLVFASNGDIYFTDQGHTGLQDPTGRLFRLTAAGHLERVLGNALSPNGLVFNPDESILYLAVTAGNAVWRVPFTAEGDLSRVGIFAQFSGGLAGPDGMAMDEAGNLTVCHAGLGCVWMLSSLGEPLYRIRSCEGVWTTNLAYGGPQRRHVYITESESGTILRAELPVPGRPMYSHQ